MRLYLVDDDDAVRGVLRLVIETGGLGTIVGEAENGADALEDLAALRPDIVLVDLLMPGMDGIELVREAKSHDPETRFVMLSQVTSKDMVAEAYDAGVDFFISKPVNAVEVRSVLGMVREKLDMDRTLLKVRSLVQSAAPVEAAPAAPAGGLTESQRSALHDVLHRLGLSGDAAYGDLIQITDFLASQRGVEQYTVSQLCQRFGGSSPKAMEQRIRRAANTGMVNLANLGIEDYSSDAFQDYAGTLYQFEQVRREMDYLRGKSPTHGKCSVKRFLYALSALATR
jgi:two-component system response regulator YcbB